MGSIVTRCPMSRSAVGARSRGGGSCSPSVSVLRCGSDPTMHSCAGGVRSTLPWLDEPTRVVHLPL